MEIGVITLGEFLSDARLGGLLYAKVAQTIELLASEVAPVVRRATAQSSTAVDAISASS